MDQLQMHYLNTVNNVALQVISDHLTVSTSYINFFKTIFNVK